MWPVHARDPGHLRQLLGKCRFVVNYDDARGHERRFPLRCVIAAKGRLSINAIRVGTGSITKLACVEYARAILFAERTGGDAASFVRVPHRRPCETVWRGWHWLTFVHIHPFARRRAEDVVLLTAVGCGCRFSRFQVPYMRHIEPGGYFGQESCKGGASQADRVGSTPTGAHTILRLVEVEDNSGANGGDWPSQRQQRLAASRDTARRCDTSCRSVRISSC
jgi:hypothetical protein